jgi:hypothetical protein
MKHHKFDWEAYLGFTVESDGGICHYIKEYGETREATLEHRVLWNQMITFKAQRDDLLEALRDLEKEFRRVFPIYYYSEPWAHDKNEKLKYAQAIIAKATGEQQ